MPGHPVDVAALKVQQRAAAGAFEVVVGMAFPSLILITGALPLAQQKLAHRSLLDQTVEAPVNGRLSNRTSFFRQISGNFLGGEVPVPKSFEQRKHQRPLARPISFSHGRSFSFRSFCHLNLSFVFTFYYWKRRLSSSFR